jgi:hypothetical protein
VAMDPLNALQVVVAWPLTSAVIVGIISVIGSVLVSRRAGTSLERTIKADREAQILEHRLPLYADILVFVAKRRQHREVITAVMRIKGEIALDPFDETEIFDILGRAHALADADVVKAFDVADEAHQVVQRFVHYQQVAQGDPDMLKRQMKMLDDKVKANEADAELESITRKSLHRDEATPLQRPDITDESVGHVPPKQTPSTLSSGSIP